MTGARVKAAPPPLEQDDIRWVHTPASILSPEQRVLVVTIGTWLKSQVRGPKGWKATYGRNLSVRKRVMHVLARIDVEQVIRHLQGAPNTIRFVRCAPRSLDTDNLATACKPVRDQVCAWLAGDNTPSARANDSIRSGYDFTYHQQRQDAYAVRIELERRT